MQIRNRILSIGAAVTACVVAMIAPPVATAAGATAGADWPTFGGGNTRTNANMAPTQITAANVGSMVRVQVKISQPIDAGLIYLHGVRVNGASRDVYFGTTNLGRTVAIDANAGKVLWEYVPPGFDEKTAAAGTATPRGLTVRQITNSTPVADDNRQYIYAADADGKVTKIAIATGKAVWSTAVTKLPNMEKLDSPLSFVKGKVLVSTAGYVGDTPPYQGHIAVLDAKSGKIEHVWNSLCSDRHELLDPKTCEQGQSAIWGRAGIVLDPSTGNLLFATGNGPYDGKTAWGDTLIMLDPNATEDAGQLDHDQQRGAEPQGPGHGFHLAGAAGRWLHRAGRQGRHDPAVVRWTHQGHRSRTRAASCRSWTCLARRSCCPLRRRRRSTARPGCSPRPRVAVPRPGPSAPTTSSPRPGTSRREATAPFYANGLLYIYETQQQAGHLLVLNAATGETVATLDMRRRALEQRRSSWTTALRCPRARLPGFMLR